jgi:hypothetical protein
MKYIPALATTPAATESGMENAFPPISMRGVELEKAAFS